MDKLILQLIAAAFVIFAISRVYLRYKERKLSSFSFIFWTFVWLAGISSIIYPDMTTKFASLIGVGRGVDAVLYASIVVIFYLIFRIYIKIEDTQREITEVVRKIALKKVRIKKSPRKSN